MRRAPLVTLSTIVGLGAVIGVQHVTGTAGSGVDLASDKVATVAGGMPIPDGPPPPLHSATKPRSYVGSYVKVGEKMFVPFGHLSVKVTEVGNRITDVQLAKLQYSSGSLGIDHYGFDRLRKQTLASQNAHVKAVSGASYTSAAYAKSLQSAIDELGVPDEYIPKPNVIEPPKTPPDCLNRNPCTL